MSAIIYAETHSTDPAFNLAFEEYVLLNKKEGSYLMLWQNANTVVVGRNQNTAAEIDADFVRDMGVTVVRRMTGGGAVYHDLGNLNYSFISDLGDAEALSIERFARPVCAALESMGVKAGLSGRNDILAEGKKVSGVAQRIYKDRILHHGTLLFDSDSSMIAGALRAHEEKFTSKSAKSVRSRVGNIRALLPEDMSLEAFWQCILRQLGGEGLEFWQPDGAELEQIEKLAECLIQSLFRCSQIPRVRLNLRTVGHEGTYTAGGVDVTLALQLAVGFLDRVWIDGDLLGKFPH